MGSPRPERVTCDKEQFSLNISRLKKGGEVFEVVIDPELALQFRKGEEVEIKEILKAEHVYKHANRSELASEHEMQKIFNTKDPVEVAKVIIKKGEIHLTKEQRDQMRDEKRKAIITAIHRYGVDPNTKAPHPITRIENALEQGKIHIDEFQSASDQVPRIVRKLAPILPISFETKRVEIKIAAADAAKCYPFIKQMATIKKENWLNDGSWLAEIEFPGGLEVEIYDKINSVTHGNAEITKII